jgi:hypothetical protein
MPPKKGKVVQVPASNDPPEGACAFVCFLRGQVCVFVRFLFHNFVRFLTQLCCEQITTKMLLSLR